MKATEGKTGRMFILHFEDGDEIPGSIEKFADEVGITAAYVAFNGGLYGGEIAAGTDSPSARPCRDCAVKITDARTTAASGLLFTGAGGKPELQLHGALGFREKAVAGSFRSGMKVWSGAEAVIYEITGVDCCREMNDRTGRMELRSPALPHPAPAPLETATVIHAGDHTHLLFAFNAEFN